MSILKKLGDAAGQAFGGVVMAGRGHGGSPLTEFVGLNAVEKVFLNDFKWAYRHQPVIDWGIDAHVEVMVKNEPTGKLIALQVKSGPSYFRKSGDDFVFYGEERHYKYWLNHALPVFIILHNPEDEMILWQKFEPRLITSRAKGRWSIPIPAANVLSSRFKPAFENGIPSDDASVRRFNLTMDTPVIRALAGKKSIYLSVDDWVNKSLNMRDSRIWYGDFDKEKPDFYFRRWMPYADIYKFMAVQFPWLSYEYVEEPDDDPEVTAHILNVELNELGRAALTMEDYFEKGAKPKSPPAPKDPIQDEREAEWDEILFRRALDRDPY